MNSVLLLENSFIQLPLSFIHDLDISKEESQYLKDFILNYINLCISIINKNYALPAAEIDTLLSSSLRPQIHSLNYSIIYPQLDLLKQIPSYKNENYIEVVQEILRSDPTLLKHLYLYPLSYFLTEAKCQELGEETLKKLEEDEAIFKEKFIHLLIFVKENFSDRQDVQEMIAYLNKDLEYVLDLRFNKAKKALFQS